MDPFDRLGEVDATKQADPATPDGKSAVTLAAESARTLMGQSAESADDKQTAWFEKNMKGTSVVDDDVDISKLMPAKVEKDTDGEGTDGDKDADTGVDTDTEDFKRAFNALKRDGVPQSTLDDLLKNHPETVLEWGGSRADAQSETDGFGRELDKLKQQVADKDPATKKDTRSTEDSEPFDAAKSDARLAKAAEPFAALIGLPAEELAPALGHYGQALTTEIASALSPTIELQTQRLDLVEGILWKMQVAHLRSDLVSSYGDSVVKRWSEIEDETQGMRLKKDESTEDFFQRATRNVLGDPPAKKKRADTTAMRDNGTASASSDRSRDNSGRYNKGPAHGEDPEIAWLAARNAGKSREESNGIAYGNRHGRRNT